MCLRWEQKLLPIGGKKMAKKPAMQQQNPRIILLVELEFENKVTWKLH